MRAAFLARCGFAVSLVQHVGFALTADHVMILAVREGSARQSVPGGAESA